MKTQIVKKMPKMVAIILMLIGVIPTTVMANNYLDTTWVFEVSYTGGSGYVDRTNRVKEDTSSSYMKCDSYVKTLSTGCGNTYIGIVHGSNTTSSNLADRYAGSNHSRSYIFAAGSTIFMINYVKEAGCDFANIYCESKYTTCARFSGVWSPDSI